MKNNRVVFSKNIALLFGEMVRAEEQFVLDYCLRSTEEQRRLWSQGRALIDGKWVEIDKSRIVTYIDGLEKKSAHQLGIAIDIYLVDKDGNIMFDLEVRQSDTPEVASKKRFYREKIIHWHKVWEEKYQGEKMLEWDLPHFELRV